MRYANDTAANEAQKVKNGEREIITDEMLNLFIGSDNPNGEAWELLLDILNGQYPLEDAISEVKDHYKEHLGI